MQEVVNRLGTSPPHQRRQFEKGGMTLTWFQRGGAWSPGEGPGGGSSLSRVRMAAARSMKDVNRLMWM